jgi:hypothetical protein
MPNYHEAPTGPGAGVRPGPPIRDGAEPPRVFFWDRDKNELTVVQSQEAGTPQTRNAGRIAETQRGISTRET